MKENKCPVCGWEMKTGEGLKVTVKQQDVQVCCEECAVKLKEEPNKYLLPM